MHKYIVCKLLTISSRFATAPAPKLLLAASLLLLTGLLTGCPQPAPKKPTPQPAATRPLVQPNRLVLARNSSHYLRVEGPISSPSRLTASIDKAPNIRITAYTLHPHRSSISSPLADQLLGQPQIAVDAGSFLAPLPTDSSGAFLINSPMPVFLHLDVPPTLGAGDYELHLSKFPETKTTDPKTLDALAPSEEQFIPLTISDIVYPTEPRILAAATTTIDDLSRLFPNTFGSFSAAYLDRTDPEHAAAVEQLDTLVKAAQSQGIALFVEDLAPTVKVDDVGKLTVEWDAYDRVISPYMDGTAFPNRVPLQVWLAPVPPRRIRDEPVQLRQYLAACVEHFLDKAWIATPAFLHPALVDPLGPQNTLALRDKITNVLQMHLKKDVLAVTTPDNNLPHPRLWIVDDTDPRLPPAGALATEESVRVWPWVCAARGIKGFVWRGALESVESVSTPETSLSIGSGRRPLLIAQKSLASDKRSASQGTQVQVLPAMRLAWLNAGMNDTAMFGLLERRDNSKVVSEVVAGVVGRTGLTTPIPFTPGDLTLAPPGFLYAAWPSDRPAWSRLPTLLEMLVSSKDPGRTTTVAPSDPLYLAAKLWLAETRRPVARTAGYRFTNSTGREGPLMNLDLEMILENPLNAEAQIEILLDNLPGDFQLAAPSSSGLSSRRFTTVNPNGLSRLKIPLAGHVESLRKTPQPQPISIRELTGGATIQIPLNIPIYRMRATDPSVSPKIDGKPDDWALDVISRDYGPMFIATRYLSRAQLLNANLTAEDGASTESSSGSGSSGGGVGKPDDQPALARWSHDPDYIYAFITCTQADISDEKNNDWPLENNRWWGTDGIQLTIASGGNLDNKRIVHIGVKPSGVVLTRATTLPPNTPSTADLKWTDAPTGLKFGIVNNRSNYTVELAIPRKWFDPNESTFRLNLLRHRASTLTSTSWSGPLINDTDLSMMGLLVAE